MGRTAFDTAAGWVLQLPVQVALAGEDGAGVAATHGDDHVRLADRIDGEGLRRLGGNIDADFGHGLDGGWVDLVAGIGAGGADFDAVAGQVGQPGGGHL
jgi:hypothetical protein